MDMIGGEIGFMAASAGKAFVTLMEPHRLMFLALGCMMGLVLGIIPGSATTSQANVPAIVLALPHEAQPPSTRQGVEIIGGAPRALDRIAQRVDNVVVLVFEPRLSAIGA